MKWNKRELVHLHGSVDGWKTSFCARPKTPRLSIVLIDHTTRSWSEYLRKNWLIASHHASQLSIISTNFTFSFVLNAFIFIIVPRRFRTSGFRSCSHWIIFCVGLHGQSPRDSRHCVGFCVQSDMRKRGKPLGQGEVRPHLDQAEMSSVSRKQANLSSPIKVV